MNFGIVGCGLIGRKRAYVIQDIGVDHVSIVADVDFSHAKALSTELDCKATRNWQDVVHDANLDAVIVATPNKYLLPITVEALKSAKHVLCEKPPGRNFDETLQMVEAARENDRLLKIGFNHRFHPAIEMARKLLANGAIGEPMFIRSIYGHGGRAGYEKEWRGQADLAGGGELLDQGVHIIDLFRWFLGEFEEVFGYTRTFFWPLGFYDQSLDRQLEDNAFALLKTDQGQVAELHTSWTQWKNKFQFEVYGKDGFLQIDGLGGSYGIETLVVGTRKIESGPPDIQKFEFDGPDISWKNEWEEFVAAIKEGRQPMSNGVDSVETMKVISSIYQSARDGRVVRLR